MAVGVRQGEHLQLVPQPQLLLPQRPVRTKKSSVAPAASDGRQLVSGVLVEKVHRVV
jgi:hypothetical protein